METYNYNENTLIHAVDFNPYKIESILQHGILSKNKANEQQIPFTKNYQGYNFEDYISMIRYFYVNFGDNNGAYNKYVPKGVSFIIENQDYIFNEKEMYFNHPDEVFVKDQVAKENIVGILVSNKYLDYEIRDLPMLPLKSTSYLNIKYTCDNLIDYLKSKNYEVNKQEYNVYLRELYYTFKVLENDSSDENLLNDFNDSKIALNEFIAEEVNLAFDNLLNKDSCTLEDMLNYINNKTLKLPFYNCSRENIRK